MDRQEATNRFKVLQAKIDQDKFHVAPHLRRDFEESLARVKFLSDGLIDESTVDGRIRSTLVAIAYQVERQEWKEAVSLKQIQQAYFDRLTNTFGEPFTLMRKADGDPYRFSAWFASDDARVKESLPVTTEFVDEICEFWEQISDPVWIHLEDSSEVKAVFAGELFPDGRSNIVGSTGIYFDTTILPDPFLKIAPLLPHMKESERVGEVLRLGLQVMAYRDLAMADIPVPLVAILPDRHSLQEQYQDFIRLCASRDAVRHAGRLFGRNFNSMEELADFLKAHKSSEEVVGALAQPDELVFATEWDGSLSSHIDKYLRENKEKLHIESPGQAVLFQILSRFAQANDSLQRSLDLRATPILRAETSWLWFNWMLRDNALVNEDEASLRLHLARALGTTVQSELQWLGNVPPAALLEIRRVGALEEIRALMGSGLREIISARPNNFNRTGDQVFENLHAAFKDHEKKLTDLRNKKWKFAGADIGSFLVVGGIEMAAAVTGVPTYGVVAAGASMLGVVPTGKDLKERLSSIRKEGKLLNSTGVGILFKNKRR